MVSWKEPERTSIAAPAVEVLLLEMSNTLKLLGRLRNSYCKGLSTPSQTSSSLLHGPGLGVGKGVGVGESDGERGGEGVGEGGREREEEAEGEGNTRGEDTAEETAGEK